MAGLPITTGPIVFPACSLKPCLRNRWYHIAAKARFGAAERRDIAVMQRQGAWAPAIGMAGDRRLGVEFCFARNVLGVCFVGESGQAIEKLAG
jgi:hypothetical protein